MFFCTSTGFGEVGKGETLSEAFDSFYEQSDYGNISDCIFYEGEQIKICIAPAPIKGAKSK